MPPLIDDPYAVLGIPNDSDEADVKKAYRKLALKYHPDRQNGKSEEEIAKASAMFVKIAEAQDILTDPVKKYDFRMKQEAKQNKVNAASTATSAAANRKGTASSVVKRSGGAVVRKRSPVPPNRQSSAHSMRHGTSPRPMDRKQASLRVNNGVGRVKIEQPRRVNSAGAIPNPRRRSSIQKAAPPVRNRSKTAQMLRTPSNASVTSRRSSVSKKPIKKPTQTVHHEGNQFSFVRNNGKISPKKPSSPPKKPSSPSKTRPSPPKKTPSGNANLPPKKKKKKKKKVEEGEQTFTFVRNGPSAKPASKGKKPKNVDSEGVAKKKTKQTGPRPSRMVSPQQATRKSVLGFNRTSLLSPKVKKKTAGIKGFLGRTPAEKV